MEQEILDHSIKASPVVAGVAYEAIAGVPLSALVNYALLAYIALAAGSILVKGWWAWHQDRRNR